MIWRWLPFLLFLLPSISFPADYTMQLHQVRVADLARIVYGDVMRQSFILDAEVIQSPTTVSLNWLNLGKRDVDTMTRQLLDLHGFELVQQGKVLLVRKRDKGDEDLLIYKPRHRAGRYLTDILAKVADVQPLGARSMQASPEFAQAASKAPEQAGSVGSMISQSAQDQLAYSCRPAQCDRLRKLLVDLDTPEPQIVLRAAVYEVGTTKGQGDALQVAASLFQGKLKANIPGTISGASTLSLSVAGLDAVLAVLDQDGRFKSISRPMLRVRTGAQAKFSVGQQVPVLGALSQDKNGNPVQSVEYRQSGTIFTVRPDVRLDVVDLDITQELSSFVQTTTGVNNSPTLLQRTASSQLSIKPGEVVVFAGLEEQREDESASRLFGWSFGKKNSDTTSQVLLFIEAQPI